MIRSAFVYEMSVIVEDVGSSSKVVRIRQSTASSTAECDFVGFIAGPRHPLAAEFNSSR